MTNLSIRNVAESVKGRLLNLARAQKRPFQELLQYYCIERFLFRLSESIYRDFFVLKGALLFKVWAIEDSRATLDIDTLARTSNKLDHIIIIVKELCELIPSIDDGVKFLTSSINGKIMQLQREYEGVRINFESRMGSAQIPMQIDIGFGDIITPDPDEIIYPALLDFPSPLLKAYPPETVIAEKIQTMVEKGESNSRIKDYYDVWLLLRIPGVSYPHLKSALLRTFETRGMPFDFTVVCSTINQFSRLPQVQVLWERFKQKNVSELYRHMSIQRLAYDLVSRLTKEIVHNP